MVETDYYYTETSAHADGTVKVFAENSKSTDKLNLHYEVLINFLLLCSERPLRTERIERYFDFTVTLTHLHVVMSTKTLEVL